MGFWRRDRQSIRQRWTFVVLAALLLSVFSRGAFLRCSDGEGQTVLKLVSHAAEPCHCPCNPDQPDRPHHHSDDCDDSPLSVEDARLSVSGSMDEVNDELLLSFAAVPSTTVACLFTPPVAPAPDRLPPALSSQLAQVTTVQLLI